MSASLRRASSLSSPPTTMAQPPDTPSHENASDAIIRAIREGRARIETTPAVRVHVTTDDGYGAHFSMCEDEDSLPSTNYVIDAGLDVDDLEPELGDAIGWTFSAEINAALAKAAHVP